MGFQGLDLSSQLVDEHRVVVAVEVNVVQHLLLAHVAPIRHRKLQKYVLISEDSEEGIFGSSPGQSLKAGFLGQELAKSHPEVHEGR